MKIEIVDKKKTNKKNMKKSMNKLKLKHITFTGIGNDTNPKTLKEIQNEFPLVEWGILMSKNWKENGPRYFNPDFIFGIKSMKLNLNLSCHVCGYCARHVINNDWRPLIQLTNYQFDIFKRCQVNISTTLPKPNTPFVRPYVTLDELIIQQRSENDLLVFDTIKNRTHMSVLLDDSNGRGIDATIRPLFRHGLKVGYAGGINPDNVGDKLYQLLRNAKEDFWIDMESGIRTEDKFDLNKVYKVLHECQKVMKEFT